MQGKIGRRGGSCGERMSDEMAQRLVCTSGYRRWRWKKNCKDLYKLIFDAIGGGFPHGVRLIAWQGKVVVVATLGSRFRMRLIKCTLKEVNTSIKIMRAQHLFGVQQYSSNFSILNMT